MISWLIGLIGAGLLVAAAVIIIYLTYRTHIERGRIRSRRRNATQEK